MYISLFLSSGWATNPSDSSNEVRQYVEAIKGRYQDVEYIEAQFVQKSIQMGMELEQTGQVFLAKPKSIRWEFKTPSEQLILSDGKELWVYTPAANQAILSEDMSQSNPIAGLIDNLSEIDSHFSLTIIETPEEVLQSIDTKRSRNTDDRQGERQEERQEKKEQKEQKKEIKKEQKNEQKSNKKEQKNNTSTKEAKSKKRKRDVVSFEIIPTDEQLAASVKQLVLTLDNSSYDVKSILVYDPMDGMVHLILSDMKIENAKTTAEKPTKREQRQKLFTFTPPEGTNVIKSNSFAP